MYSQYCVIRGESDFWNVFNSWAVINMHVLITADELKTLRRKFPTAWEMRAAEAYTGTYVRVHVYVYVGLYISHVSVAFGTSKWKVR